MPIRTTLKLRGKVGTRDSNLKNVGKKVVFKTFRPNDFIQEDNRDRK